MYPSRRQFVQWSAASGFGCVARAAPPPGDALTLFIWSGYVPPETLSAFSTEHGVQVVLETYESNEELVAALRAEPGRYDLVVPSCDTLPGLVRAGLLQPLRRDLLPNREHLADLFWENPYDPGDRFSVPYLWGTTGLAWRSDKVTLVPASWRVFHKSALARRMTQLDDPHDAIGAWLKFRAYSINSADPAELAVAKSDALLAKANLRAYRSAPVKKDLISGEVWIAQLWNGDAAQAALEEPAIRYVIPDEGSSLWTDCVAVPRGARNPVAAHAFIDFVHRPEVAAAIARFTHYGTPNASANALLERPTAFPTTRELFQLEFFGDLGESRPVWDAIWRELRAD